MVLYERVLLMKLEKITFYPEKQHLTPIANGFLLHHLLLFLVCMLFNALVFPFCRSIRTNGMVALP